MKTSAFLPALAILSGIGLAAFGLSGLRSAKAMPHNQNPLAVQGSAYGKLLARLSETTIDRVWHLGVEQIVPHYMSGDAEHGHESPGAATTDAAIAAKASLKERASSGSPLARAKLWFNDRVVAQHSRTNPKALNERHLATVHRDIERMLLRSFKLDPTHYGAYDSYHLFLTTYDLGGDPYARARAEEIAKVAIGTAFREDEDPEPWLTAAAAAMNLYLLDATPFMEAGEALPLELLKKHRDQVGYCLARFEQLQSEAEQSGVWENLSLERQMEVAERSLFAKRTFKQFDAMIARAENPEAKAAAEGEVAKKGEAEEGRGGERP
jgi:hypothetical protein